MLDRQDHGFKRPGCPPGTHYDERVVLKDDSFLLLAFQLCIIDQHMASSLLAVVLLKVLEFEGRLFGKSGRCPDLPMRMWIRASHRRAFVLKYLHPPELIFWHGNLGVRVRRRGVGRLRNSGEWRGR